MFVGHFAVGLAAKKAAPTLNLGLLFIGCQLLDFIWPILVLSGIEKVSVDHSATSVTPLDFSYYPFSHSLLMTVVYAVILGFFVAKRYHAKKIGIVFGLVIVSHWFLDLLTHRPDLPLFLNQMKFGFGLWNSVIATMVIELGLFAAGIVYYLKASPLVTKKRILIFWSMIVFLILVYSSVFLGPKPPVGADPKIIAGPALAMWIIVVWGYFADK